VIQKRLALVKESADTLRNLIINIAQNQKHTEVRADKKNKYQYNETDAVIKNKFN